MTEELANHALRLPLSPDEASQAASDIMTLLDLDKQSKLPKEVLDTVIAESLEALCMFSSLNPAQISEIVERLFYIFVCISTDRKDLEAIVAVANERGIFDQIINITYSTMKNEGQEWNVAINNAAFFLYDLLMDVNSDYSNKIRSDLSSNTEFFLLIFKQAIRSIYQGGVLIVASLLRFESGEILRETIGEEAVRMLLKGTRIQPGLLAQAIRLNKEWTVYSTLLLIENLILTNTKVRTYTMRMLFIKNNVVGFLFKSIRMKNFYVTTVALQIIGNLLDRGDISDDIAKYIAKEMISDHLLTPEDHEHQHLHFCTLSKLFTRGIVTQKILMNTKVVKWNCKHISAERNKEPIKDVAKVQLLLEKLRFCWQLLKFMTKQESKELWKDEEKEASSQCKSNFINPIYDSKFASGLINILVQGNAQLQQQSISVMLAALALPSDRFAPILYKAVDKTCGVNVAIALFNAVNNDMRADKPDVSLIYSAIELLRKLLNDDALKETLIALAKTKTTHAPLRILSCRDGSSTTIFFMQSDSILSSDDLFVLSTENQALCDSIAEYIQSNTFHFPLNILFSPTFQDCSSLTKKVRMTIEMLLNICKEMLVDEDLKLLWAPFRKQLNNLKFNSISIKFNGENSSIANEIYCMLDETNASELK